MKKTEFHLDMALTRTVRLLFATLFVILVVVFPKSPKFGYEYKRGQEWKYETLLAQYDFPIYKTDEQIREEKANVSAMKAVPYFRFSDELVNRNLKAVEGLDFGEYSSVRNRAISVMRDIYSHGILADDVLRPDRKSDNLSKDVLYIQKDKRAGKYPVSEVYRQTEAREKLLTDVSSFFPKENVDSLFKLHNINDFVVPNLIFDRQTTDLVLSESSVDVSPTQGFVSAGQLIVSNGEIVTAEIEQILDSYRKEYNQNVGYSKGPGVLLWLGDALVALMLIVIMVLSLFFTKKTIFKDIRSLSYLLLIFLLTTVVALVVDKTSSEYLFMVPFTLSALYLQAFFRARLIVPFYVISLLPLLIFCQNGTVLYVIFLLAGLVNVFTFKYFSRGWKQFIAVGISCLFMLLAYFGFYFMDMIGGDVLKHVAFLIIGSMLTVAFYPLIFLFEKIFNLVSNNRLEELVNTSTPLLLELEEKAPGTFQHSVQVMSMAEVVARSIGANATLIKAGALYHDIGKINNPTCFIENERLVGDGSSHYHEGLSPEQSASEIIRHVSDGLAIAEKNKLPDVVKDFILTHHGTTRTAYFYNKYVNAGGDPEAVEKFLYNGRKPFTKEQIILMLCDSIEAASRTMTERTAESYSKLVDSLVEGKMKEGQFEDADISLKDLNTVKDEIKAYLPQMYHERIKYPKRNK